MAIDPIELATKMGLKVEVRNITKDLSIFGQVFFMILIQNSMIQKKMK